MSYHHGHLGDALVDAGYELARTGGPDAVTVRAAARASGVSAPAAYRHYADRAELVAVVAQRCREELARRLIAARDHHRSPRLRFRATGRAYVQFALDEPGLVACAFTFDPQRPAPDCGPDDPDAYAVLSGCLDALADSGDLPAERRDGAELVAWSAVHGLALLLAAGGASVTTPTGAEHTRQSIERVLDGVEQALLVDQERPRARPRARSPKRTG